MESKELQKIIEDIKYHEKRYPNFIVCSSTDYHLYLTRNTTTLTPYGEDGDMRMMNIFDGALEDGFDMATIYEKKSHKTRSFEIKTSKHFDRSITINTTIADLFNN